MLSRLLPVLLVLIMALPGVARAEENRISIRGSNLEIPRFVTLKTNKANMRSGPGMDYPIKWEYRRRGMPLKVVGEFDIWRKVVDPDGETGWLHKQTLSGKRMALVTGSMVKVRAYDDAQSRVVAVAEKGVLAELNGCRGQWCRINTDSVDGWIRRNAIWGLLEGERLE
ncbi:MAG: SH3 domain-containing protein [Candidatus Puniceispirillales bacterium]